MEQSLNAVGIATAEELRAMGGDAAYELLLKSGTQPHFIAFYALHMALQGRPWNDCKGAEKAQLRKQFDAIKARAATVTPTGIERELDRLGVGDPARR